MYGVTLRSSLSSNVASAIDECQDGAASLLPLIMGFSSAGFAIVGV
jgi:hypothetical protein